MFDLSPRVPDKPAAADLPHGGLLIWVDKPSVAGYFDRAQMVTREDGGSRISIHEFEVWSDPPADLIQRALVNDLARRFGSDRVMATTCRALCGARMANSARCDSFRCG